MSPEVTADEGSSIRIARCALAVSDEPWPFAQHRGKDISAHWKRSLSERPKLFDGTVYMLRGYALDAGTFNGTFLRTDFKSFLYWRECGYADADVRDGFGSSVIRSCDGHVLLGLQTSGNVNGGLAYPPGGFIDARDVLGTAVDIEASIVRELGEETGLEPGSLVRVPGYVLTLAGPFVSIAIEWRSALPADALRMRILDHIQRQPAPELADVVIVRTRDEIDDRTMPVYARTMLRHLLAA